MPGVELSLAMLAAHANTAGTTAAPRDGGAGHRTLLHCGEMVVSRLKDGRDLCGAKVKSCLAKITHRGCNAAR